MNDLKHIIESLIFVSDEPLTMAALKTVVDIAETGEIRDALNELIEEYNNRKGGFYLREIAGGYQFRTRPEHNDWIKRLLKPNPQRLSKASLETLAIIAYKQPIIRSDIEHIRGVDCGGVLRMLMERKLIRILGRKEIPGRPLIYATTKQFLEVFHLKDLRDLPSPKEIEELSRYADEASGDLQMQSALPFEEEVPPVPVEEIEEAPDEESLDPNQLAKKISAEAQSGLMDGAPPSDELPWEQTEAEEEMEPETDESAEPPEQLSAEPETEPGTPPAGFPPEKNSEAEPEPSAEGDSADAGKEFDGIAGKTAEADTVDEAAPAPAMEPDLEETAQHQGSGEISLRQIPPVQREAGEGDTVITGEMDEKGGSPDAPEGKNA